MRKLRNDLTGQKFGRALVLKRVENKGIRVAYLCRCDCGNEFIALAHHLKGGGTKSCGCLRSDASIKRARKLLYKHGKCDTNLYKTWSSIKARCLCKTHRAFKNYGGRGITLCIEWANDFLVFEKWALANGYKKGLTIDRIDNNGNYEPSNCRWTTRTVQQNNRRTNRFIEYNGKKRTLSQWSKILNIPETTLFGRLKNNWPLDKVFSQNKYRGQRGFRNG